MAAKWTVDDWKLVRIKGRPLVELHYIGSRQDMSPWNAESLCTRIRNRGRQGLDTGLEEDALAALVEAARKEEAC